ncbi:hypothetical protein [Burkholderia anthina]|uniref:DUF2591 domain-containing protein n=2 Tax=Burkholderia anthina TaxID=179879 RepID=A0ABS2BCN4_9BURK|nr:hypothetical protein [Burkholderia anthina]MBM2769929.1 hypothetical protein [Burkholderia anthina]
MKWMNERPMVEGFYWIAEAGRAPEPVEVANKSWGPCAQYIGDECSHDISEAWADNVRWCGPIAAPSDDPAKMGREALTAEQIALVLEIWEQHPGAEFADQLRAMLGTRA